jgi:DNA-binding NtrC family response regulator
MHVPVVLLVESSPVAVFEWNHLFSGHRVKVLRSPSKAELLDTLNRLAAGILVLETDEDLLGWAQSVRSISRSLPVVAYMATSSEERAITALRIGVNDYVRQSSAPEELVRAVSRWASASTDPVEHGLARGRPIVGQSAFAGDLRVRIAKAAAHESNVLISGETGTGKELVAEAIHENGQRRQHPMVCVNCAAIPESLVESELFGHERGAFTGAAAASQGKLQCAEGGTIFFDEIGDMSLAAQAKILRVIESKQYQRLGGKLNVPFNARIVAATNQNVERFVEEEKFRKDLYFRLNVFRIHLAPIRERPEDIPPLVSHFVSLLNHSFGQVVEGFTDEVRDRLMQYTWPGNVREIRNIMEAVFMDAPPPIIGYCDLPKAFRSHLENSTVVTLPERSRMLAALQSTHWNVTRAAEQLHCSRMTFYRKMAKHHIASEKR